MIYVKFDGRLGNNLFQLAAGLNLAIENNDEVVAPRADFYKFINFVPQHASFLQYSSHYTEPCFEYKKIPYTKDMLMTGYFQSEKYFKDNKEAVIKKLSIKQVYEEQIKEKYRDLLAQDTISLHVRRTDYVNIQDYHPLQTLDYYNKALEYIGTKDRKVVVFSDDIEWCKTKFVGDKFVFIEKNIPIVDMFLMSYCNHHIIANSSFSWWGAYFNQNENKKVVAPSNWFGSTANLNSKDIYCSDWYII
jgi:hypothetical protein